MKRLIVGTSGHIDHGKSALVKALTGTDPDRLPEEKSRGITIDLGFAHASWDGIVFSFVDVPGHEKFVRTMVAGATGIDLALLVVASDDSVMPQTREHLSILSLLGVRSGVLVRTKSDLVDGETGSLVDEEIRDLVKGTFLERAPLVAVSAVSAVSATSENGIPALRAALAAAASRLSGRDPAARVTRLFIDRVFTIRGFGPVVTGTLDGGRITQEDRLTLWPDGKEVRARRVEVHGAERKDAEAGERTSVNLAGVERDELARGQTLAAPGALTPSRLLTVEIQLLPSVDAPLPHGARVRFHHGTADVAARLSLVTPAGAKEPVRALSPGASAWAQIVCAVPVAAVRGDRFILRRPSPVETLGGGRVLDAGWKRIARSSTPRAEVLSALAGFDEPAAARVMLEEAGASGLETKALTQRLGMTEAQGAALAAALTSNGLALRLGGGPLVSAASTVKMTGRAAEILEAHRRSGGPSSFLSRSEFVEKLGKGLAPRIQEAWLALLSAGGKLTLDGDRVGPAGTQAADSGNPFARRVEEGYRKGAFDPPKSFELAREIGTKPQVVEGLVGHLLKNGALLRLSPEVVVHRETVAAVEAKLVAVKGKTLSIADFRDLLGLTRKNLIPLLEHLDRVRKTRRVGDSRLVL